MGGPRQRARGTWSAAMCCSRTARAAQLLAGPKSPVSTTGLVIAHYERTGDIKIGDTALDSPSDAEGARQERMKREG